MNLRLGARTLLRDVRGGLPHARLEAAIGAALIVGLAAPACAKVLYSTGFEAPDFSLGALAGQGGWSIYDQDAVRDPAGVAVVVENTVTHDGQQAVELPFITASGDVPYYAYGPITPTGPIVVSMAMNLQANFVAPADFAVATSPGYSGITAGVRLYGDGEIHAISPGFADIGTYTQGDWIDLSMTLDYATQTFSVSLDGTLLASNLAFCGDMPNSNTCNGDHVSRFGDVEFDPGEPKLASKAYIDDVSISEVPEPGAWGLLVAGLGFAGAGLRSRRRLAVPGG